MIYLPNLSRKSLCMSEGAVMKGLVARLTIWSSIVAATAMPAMAQSTFPYSYTAGGSGACAGSASCEITFPVVSSPLNPDAILNVGKVSCRLLTSGALSLSYAALSKSADTSKMEFLAGPAYAAQYTGPGAVGIYAYSTIADTTMFFVQSGASPIVFIYLNNGFPFVEAPTCTVTGYMQ